MAIVSGIQEYAIRANWKLLVESTAPWGRPIANWIPKWGEYGKKKLETIRACMLSGTITGVSLPKTHTTG